MLALNHNGCKIGAAAELAEMKPLLALKPNTTRYADSARRILACRVHFVKRVDKMTTEKRSIFDWLIFTLIHVVVIGAIAYAGVQVYGPRLGLWVAASATVAGFASCYLFAKDVPGETLMKCWLYLCVAANAGYLVHNGARQIGVTAYNAAQVEKFEKGMAEAGKATSRRIARELRLGAKDASQIEMAFSDGVSVIVAILAFLELASALVIFAIGSHRSVQPAAIVAQQGTHNCLVPNAHARAERGEFDAITEVPETGKLPELPGPKVHRR